MFSLKLDDKGCIKKYLKEGLIKQFPKDNSGNLSIIYKDFTFNLQKEILSENSLYFNQISSIDNLVKIEISIENFEEKEIFYKIMHILYYNEENFSINELNSLVRIIEFLKIKDLKVNLLDCLKKIFGEVKFEEKFIILNFIVENNLKNENSFFNSLKKNCLIKNFDFEKNINIFSLISKKTFIKLLDNCIEYEENLKKDPEIIEIANKIIENYCKINNFDIENENLLKQKIINKKIPNQISSDYSNEINQLKKSNKDLQEKVEDLMKKEKKYFKEIQKLYEKIDSINHTNGKYFKNNEHSADDFLGKKKSKRHRKFPKNENNENFPEEWNDKKYDLKKNFSNFPFKNKKKDKSGMGNFNNNKEETKYQSSKGNNQIERNQDFNIGEKNLKRNSDKIKDENNNEKIIFDENYVIFAEQQILFIKEYLFNKFSDISNPDQKRKISLKKVYDGINNKFKLKVLYKKLEKANEIKEKNNLGFLFVFEDKATKTLFGGFTGKDQFINKGWKNDQNVFIFNITQKIIFNLKEKFVNELNFCCKEHYFSFGNDILIMDRANINANNFGYPDMFENKDYLNKNFIDNNKAFYLNSFQVFNVSISVEQNEI